jgi:hypothetical protein
MWRDLCIALILAKIWEFTIDFIVKNLMKFANIELCRGLVALLPIGVLSFSIVGGSLSLTP